MELLMVSKFAIKTGMWDAEGQRRHARQTAAGALAALSKAISFLWESLLYA